MIGTTLDKDIHQIIQKKLGYWWWFGAAMVLEPLRANPEASLHWHPNNKLLDITDNLQWTLAETAMQANLTDDRFDGRYYNAVDRVERARYVVPLSSATAAPGGQTEEMEACIGELETLNTQLEQSNRETEKANTRLKTNNAELKQANITLGQRNADLEKRNVALEDHNAELDTELDHEKELRRTIELRPSKTDTDPQTVLTHVAQLQQQLEIEKERWEEQVRKLETSNKALLDRAASHEVETRVPQPRQIRLFLPRNRFGYLTSVQYVTNLARDGFQNEIYRRLESSGPDWFKLYAQAGMDKSQVSSALNEQRPACLIDHNNAKHFFITYSAKLGNLRRAFDEVRKIRNKASHPAGTEYDASEAANDVREIRQWVSSVGLEEHARLIGKVERQLTALALSQNTPTHAGAD